MESSPPFSVKRHLNGRGLYAARPIAPGEVLLAFTPTILIPSLSHTESICSYCFKAGQPRSCSRCRAVAYCDAACQSAAWTAVHSKECKLLQKVAAQGRPGLPTPVRAVVQALAKKEIGAALEGLASNIEHWRTTDKWADMEMMAMGASAFAGKGTTQDDIQKAVTLLGQVQTNAFHRYDADIGQVGIFLEPKLAMVNHSCIPNAFVHFMGRKAILRAERPIKYDEEITISYIDYTHPLSKRTKALDPYFFVCGCRRCKQNLNVYQVCTQSPVIDLNFPSLVSDPSKLREHPAGEDWDIASVATKHGEELADLIDVKEASSSLEERRAVLRTWYQKCQPLVAKDWWAISPLPQVLAEMVILYADEGNFVYALATACHVAAACDPYRHVAPFHPIRVKGLFLIAKLLTNTAPDAVSLSTSVQAVVSRGDFNQRTLEVLQEIDQVSLCQMLLIMVLDSVPKAYVQEWELTSSARQMLDEILQLPGRDRELSLINMWQEDPEEEHARAFFEYAVQKQVDALASLGLEILKVDFGS